MDHQGSAALKVILITKHFTSLLCFLFVMCIPLLLHKLHEDRDICQFCSLVYPKLGIPKTGASTCQASDKHFWMGRRGEGKKTGVITLPVSVKLMRQVALSLFYGRNLGIRSEGPLLKTPWWLAKPKLLIITSSVPGLYNLILESSSFPSRTQGYLSPLELVFTESLGPTDPERCSGPQERTQSLLEEVSRKAWIHAV